VWKQAAASYAVRDDISANQDAIDLMMGASTVIWM